MIREEDTTATIEVEATSDVEIRRSDIISKNVTDSREETYLFIDSVLSTLFIHAIYRKNNKHIQ